MHHLHKYKIEENDYKIDIDKKKIVLAEPLKSLGDHNIKVKLHKDVTAELKIRVAEV